MEDSAVEESTVDTSKVVVVVPVDQDESKIDKGISAPALLKSFDMPSIDCEETESHVRQTREDDETNVSLSNLQDQEKRRSEASSGTGGSEKCHHPGIENVIEKLKKSAAAHQDGVHPPATKPLNGLKKLILHSCETSEPMHTDQRNWASNPNPEKYLTSSPRICDEFVDNKERSSNNNSAIISDNNNVSGSSDINNTAKGKAIEQAKQPTSVDISGLELLSNSIEQLEQLKPSDELESPKGVAQPSENNNNVDSPLGLLCALAEQRFMEEVGDRAVPRKSEVKLNEDVSLAGKLLITLGNKRRNEAIDKYEAKRSKSEDTAVVGREEQEEDSERSSDDDEGSESECDERSGESKLHTYKTPRGKTEALKYIAKKVHPSERDGSWPKIDMMELDMRVRLADIQRQYKQTQKELSKLTPKKDSAKRSLAATGRAAMVKKKSRSLSFECVTGDARMYEEDDTSNYDSQTETEKLTEDDGKIDSCSESPARRVTALESPLAFNDLDDDNTSGSQLSDLQASGALSSSKKRKVGRPKKLQSGGTRHLTETIVAKKPKGKHQQFAPLSMKVNSFGGGAQKKRSHKSKPPKQTPLHNKNVISSIIAEKARHSLDSKLDKQANKVRPKLKAEVKLKEWEDDTDSAADLNNLDENVPPVSNSIDEQSTVEFDLDEKLSSSVNEEEDSEAPEESREVLKSKKKKRKSSSVSPSRRKSSSSEESREKKRRKSLECKECARVAKAEKLENNSGGGEVNKCKLTEAHLTDDQLRVLTAMGGLFYAGRLSAVQAPDVYAITLDGERGNRPHIHSREEILSDAIVEICPTSTKELPPGTRLCAYWSQQYRCLYPGTSVEPSEPDSELDEKFVSVEFDDGDSGRIALDDIRLLQPDYPVVEYDPNPLLTLGKRRRHTSLSADEKRPSTINNGAQLGEQASSKTLTLTPAVFNPQSAGNNKGVAETTIDEKVMEEYRERKRLKKKRRDKLKRLHQCHEGKRKHRKHKCCEEHRKHRHRKHRKHKHKHAHHSSSHSEGSHARYDLLERFFFFFNFLCHILIFGISFVVSVEARVRSKRARKTSTARKQ